MTTRNQQFAAKAFEQVSSLNQDPGRNEAFQAKYGSLAHRLPFLVRSAGLAQALEFVAARGGEEGTLILNHLAINLNRNDGRTLRDRVRSAPLNEYMRLTHDILTVLQWYKRFVQSVLDIEPGEDNPE